METVQSEPVSLNDMKIQGIYREIHPDLSRGRGDSRGIFIYFQQVMKIYAIFLSGNLK